jgi:hypothetical protein
MTLNRPVTLLCLAGVAVASSGCGDDDGAAATRPAAAPAATATATAPLAVARKAKHRSGVTGTATLTPAGEQLKVTLTLDERLPGPLMAHIHTGPCSDEPTAADPRVWVTLTDVADGRSKTTVDLVTLPDLRSETTSINVHDPDHANRPLVCGDIPRAG